MSTGNVRKIKNENLSFFRFRRLGQIYVLTNDGGHHVFLSAREFAALLDGTLDPSHEKTAVLAEKGFIRFTDTLDWQTRRFGQKNAYLFAGPSLHIFVLTLRCNQTCTYCQAGRRPMDCVGVDMDPNTAQRAVEIAFESPAPALTIEFQGGEPLANPTTLRAVVAHARKKSRQTNKKLFFTLVSNLALLDEKMLDFLVDEGIQICTSLDGPADLHDHNRPLRNGSSHALTIEWMEKINARYKQRGFDPGLAHVNALLTVSNKTLARPRAVVDEYVERGLKVIHLRPLQPFGFAQKHWQKASYSAQQFLRFYEKALDYIIELNQQGVEIQEKTASLFLTKILTTRDPNYMDLRSPCGAGIGQLAYNYDGRVYTCDEARMIGAMGDDIFCIGNVGRDHYADLIGHGGVRTLAVASCLDGLPECTDCAYAPYCGVCPVYSYATAGDIFPHAPSCARCKIQKGILDMLFARLARGGEEMTQLFLRWTVDRDRSPVYRKRD